MYCTCLKFQNNDILCIIISERLRCIPEMKDMSRSILQVFFVTSRPTRTIVSSFFLALKCISIFLISDVHETVFLNSYT